MILQCRRWWPGGSPTAEDPSRQRQAKSESVKEISKDCDQTEETAAAASVVNGWAGLGQDGGTQGTKWLGHCKKRQQMIGNLL